MLTSSINMKKPPACICKPAARENCTGTYATSLTLTNLPIRPRSRNSTTPVTLAKSVSSLPQPTFKPGLILVPRWRTMIEPPGTSCPPNTLTPSRCALESRPFRELPNPFLCAITHLNDDIAHLHVREVLPVPLGALVLLLALEFEHQHLLAAAARDDGRLHLPRVGARQQFTAVLKDSQGGELDFRARIAVQFAHADHISRGHPVLFSAGFDNRVH